MSVRGRAESHLSAVVEEGAILAPLAYIPSGWQVRKLEEVAAGTRNAIVGGPFGSELVSKDYTDSGVPVIRGQNMGQKYVSGPFVYVTQEKAKLLQANLAMPGDLVFTQRGTLGQVSLVPKHPYDRYVVSQSQMKISLDCERSDPKFFYHLFSSPEQQEIVRQSTIQTGVPHINLGILRGFSALVPHLSEQRTIAASLSDVDSLIRGLDTLIAKKRAIRWTASQGLLSGHIRLRGFGRRDSGWRHTEIGRIPEDWTIRRLGDEVEALEAGVSVRSGLEDSESHFEASVLKTSACASGQFRPAECKPIIKTDLHRVKLYVRADRILISRMNTPDLVGECGYVDRDYPSLFLPDRIWMTRFPKSSRVCALWLSQLLSGSEYKRRLRESATGTSGSMKNLSKGSLLNMLIAWPSAEEQRAIATVLSGMDAEVTALERRRQKANALKQGMMQQLLTGRIRLMQPEVVA